MTEMEKLEKNQQKKIVKLINKFDSKTDILYNYIEWIATNSKNVTEFKAQITELMNELMLYFDEELYSLLLGSYTQAGGKEYEVPVWEGTTYRGRLSNLQKSLQKDLVKYYKLNGITSTKPLLVKNQRKLKNAVKRIAVTENDKALNDGKLNQLKNNGYRKFRVKAVIDSRTSDICREMNGREFFLKDYETGITAPPFHPNCRSIIEEVKDE